MLEISEIFGPTVQGEGKFVGTPSIFIRFAKCNFSCEGFGVSYEIKNKKKFGCDTYYSVDKDFKNEWKKYKTYLDVIKEVDKLCSNINYKIDIVITGGEPLLYWNNNEFQNLLKYYFENSHKITIETNASIDIKFNFDYQKNILFSMSVKLSNSLESLNKRFKKNAITNIIENTKDSYLKFVLDKNFLSQAELEIQDIIKNIPKCEVYIMPLGNTSKQISSNSQSLIAFAIKKGFKYCDRLHVRVWDNKIGV